MLSFILGCIQTVKEEPNAVQEEVPINPIVAEKEIVSLNLKGMPDEQRALIGNQCSGIEASFYYSSKSISSKDCASFLNMLLPTQPTILSKNEVGHVSFIVNGDIYCMAKIILSDSTNYFRFEIDTNKYYYNLSESGISFFQGMAE